MWTPSKLCQSHVQGASPEDQSFSSLGRQRPLVLGQVDQHNSVGVAPYASRRSGQVLQASWRFHSLSTHLDDELEYIKCGQAFRASLEWQVHKHVISLCSLLVSHLRLLGVSQRRPVRLTSCSLLLASVSYQIQSQMAGCPTSFGPSVFSSPTKNTPTGSNLGLASLAL